MYVNYETDLDGQEDGESYYKEQVMDTLNYLYLNDKEFWLQTWSFIAAEEKTHDREKLKAALPEWFEEILEDIRMNFDTMWGALDYPTDSKTLKEWSLRLYKKWNAEREGE